MATCGSKSSAAAAQGGGASKARAGDKDGRVAGAGAARGGGALWLWVALLCVSQLAMFIFTKRAARAARLPLFICLAQFAASALCTALVAPLLTGSSGVTWMSRSQRAAIIPLGVVWALAFVLLTASVAQMSAANAGAVRSMEPMASVILGRLALGERHSSAVVLSLAPICCGVVLASYGGGELTATGVLLASLSNFGFSARPFLAKKAQASVGRKLNEVSIFFNVMLVGVICLVLVSFPLEGAALLSALRSLASSGRLLPFLGDVLANSISFFLYQFAQLRVMSQLTPLTFSVLTPVSKAALIVACALHFGDPFGASNGLGVALSTAGVLLFSAAKRRSS